jgi:hypothetical protein
MQQNRDRPHQAIERECAPRLRTVGTVNFLRNLDHGRVSGRPLSSTDVRLVVGYEPGAHLQCVMSTG